MTVAQAVTWLASLAVISACTARLVCFITQDEWPPILWLRERVLAWARGQRRRKTGSAAGEFYIPNGPSLAHPAVEELATCEWCVAVWVGLPVFLAWWALHPIPLPAFTAGALCWGAGRLATRDGGKA